VSAYLVLGDFGAHELAGEPLCLDAEVRRLLQHERARDEDKAEVVRVQAQCGLQLLQLL
jgi:hypothetical protein